MPRSPSSSSRVSTPSTAPTVSRRPIFPFVVIGVVLFAALTLRLVRWMRAPVVPAAEQRMEGATGDIDALLQNVARHIILPVGEVPTVATIQDIALAREQNPVLYRDAQNGDRLIAWSTQLVVFSPSRDRVLAILPITPPPTTTLTTSSTTSTAPVTEIRSLEIRNGTAVAGLAKRATDQLKKTSPFTLLPFAAASRKDYQQTLIVVPAESSPEALQMITSFVAGTVVMALPAGEASTTADVLVILGQDASTKY